MPAWRLDHENRKVCHFDVGAMDGDTPGFLTHAVLCLAEQPQIINRDQRSVVIVHVGPPLESARRDIDAIGTAAAGQDGLDPSERRQIKLFVDDRLSEQKAQEARLARVQAVESRLSEYVIHPPYVEPDDGVSLWRFSCVGFVLRAYKEAQLHLLEVENLPAVDLDTLKRAYPRFARLLDRQELRARLGIGEGTAWPIVLVGYIMHSLARDRAGILAGPYVVQRGDEFFAAQAP
jgi:hypothetical protein